MEARRRSTWAVQIAERDRACRALAGLPAEPRMRRRTAAERSIWGECPACDVPHGEPFSSFIFDFPGDQLSSDSVHRALR
jgi:hypothetical protein